MPMFSQISTRAAPTPARNATPKILRYRFIVLVLLRFHAIQQIGGIGYD